MKRISCVALLVLGLTAMVLGGGVGTSAAAKPAPTPSAVLTDDGACTFTLTASWDKSGKIGQAKIDQVYGFWYLDGNYWATSEAPGTGPNAGTFSRGSAVFGAGPATATPGVTHDWQVLVQFYSGGAFVTQVSSNIDTTECSLG